MPLLLPIRASAGRRPLVLHLLRSTGSLPCQIIPTLKPCYPTSLGISARASYMVNTLDCLWCTLRLNYMHYQGRLCSSSLSAYTYYRLSFPRVLFPYSLHPSVDAFPISRQRRTRSDMAMLYVICFMFTLSTAQWGSRLTRNILELVHLADGASETKSEMAMLKNAISASDMTFALSLVNVS
jgi:hypothetical protein